MRGGGSELKDINSNRLKKRRVSHQGFEGGMGRREGGRELEYTQVCKFKTQSRKKIFVNSL